MIKLWEITFLKFFYMTFTFFSFKIGIHFSCNSDKVAFIFLILFYIYICIKIISKYNNKSINFIIYIL